MWWCQTYCKWWLQGCRYCFQESDGVFNVPNAVSPVYEIYMQDQKFDSAVITFDYTPKNNERLEYFSILMMEATHLFRKERRQNSSIFKILLGKIIVDKSDYKPSLDIALVIDNSGSMYPQEQCEGSNENDVDFKRIDMAKLLLSRLRLQQGSVSIHLHMM